MIHFLCLPAVTRMSCSGDELSRYVVLRLSQALERQNFYVCDARATPVRVARKFVQAVQLDSGSLALAFSPSVKTTDISNGVGA